MQHIQMLNKSDVLYSEGVLLSEKVPRLRLLFFLIRDHENKKVSTGHW